MLVHRASLLLSGLLSLLALAAPAAVNAAGADRFESAPVHPLELSADGTLLFAVHTDDHRVAVFSLTQGPVPVLVAEIPVGIEPITVRVRGDRLWVVNHVSDSISIIDLTTLNVVRTLLVGDEPTDVVFAGNPARAFVCMSQEDRIRVYDAANPGPVLAEIPLVANDPRSLAVSLDGSKVYVGILDSGNRTTVVPERLVSESMQLPPPNPPRGPTVPPPPKVALIVKHNGTSWVDEINRSWSWLLHYTLTDNDVIEINASTATVTRTFKGVSTFIYNLAVNPATGNLVATTQDALNHIRFEPNLKGRFVRNETVRVDAVSGAVTTGNLNAHIDLNNPAGNAVERALSLSLPMDLTVSPSGAKTYVAAFGSAKVGVLDAAGNVTARVPVGLGPCGLALDTPRSRLYVLNAIDNSLSVVDATTETVAHTLPLGFDPVPENIREGRRIFYDGENSSSHGDLSCASCHLFVGMDNLAWDLGDPNGSMQPPPPGNPGLSGFHPMKGPMTTQTLKGIEGTEPFHWRGDRETLGDFNPAFVGLMGRAAQLPAEDMDLFEEFVFAVRNLPNPNRNLDDSLPDPPTGPSAKKGEMLFMSGRLVGNLDCVTCHRLPAGENGQIMPDSQLPDDQDLNIPHLRDLYDKTGFDNTLSQTVRGFGFTNDGAVDDLFDHVSTVGVNFANDNDRRHMVAFMLAFDSGTPAGVGAQWTMDGTNETAGLPRLNSLIGAAQTGAIGLIAKGKNGTDGARGWAFSGNGSWISDRAAEGAVSTATLLDLAAPGTEITFTAVLAGCQNRLGVDHDEDGYRDRDELDAGSDPDNPLSDPTLVAVPDEPARFTRAVLQAAPNPASPLGTQLSYALAAPGPARLMVVDIQGRAVRTLVDRADHPVGAFTETWNLLDDARREVSAGVYFAILKTADGTQSRRINVLR